MASWFVPAGRRATETHEPRQVRKEAAISDGFCVAECPDRIAEPMPAVHSKEGAQTFPPVLKKRFINSRE